MPRKPAAPPKPKPVLSRPEVVGLCKRFLKPGAYDPRRDGMVLYKLLKQYPNRDFWLAYTLSWQPDNMFYFLSAHGQAQLASDWATFCLDLPVQPVHTLEAAKVGPDVEIDTRPRTIADLLK